MPVWRQGCFEHRPTADAKVKTSLACMECTVTSVTSTGCSLRQQDLLSTYYAPMDPGSPVHFLYLYFILLQIISSIQQPSEVRILTHHCRWWNWDPVTSTSRCTPLVNVKLQFRPVHFLLHRSLSTPANITSAIQRIHQNSSVSRQRRNKDKIPVEWSIGWVYVCLHSPGEQLSDSAAFLRPHSQNGKM